LLNVYAGLISYSEATRYTPRKRLETEAWCRTHNKAIGKHLLYPRSKGFIATIQKLRSTPQVKAVYDVTIAYAKDDKGFQQAPTFTQSILSPDLGKHWRFFVHVDRFAIEDLPLHAEDLAKWLEERWVAKGERLEALDQRLLHGLPWQPF